MRFLLLLVVMTLLACHGAFGALHVVPNEFGSAISGGDHVAHQVAMPTMPADDGIPADHAGAAADYAAVLSVLVLGTLLWALRRLDRARWLASTSLALDTSNAPRESRSPTPIRGPDAPRLQVFRL